MKKNLFNYLLAGVGLLSIVFGIICLIMSGNGEVFSAVGTFTRTEAMFIDIIDNTRLTLRYISLGFGFTLMITGLTLVVVGLKKALQSK